ncbi:MAG: KpsF/GutQ family sugar-phosphate isomerase [Saprospiraceae bacterium]|nr:KpsF/GutQ family sugar-phosphate isomerase [Saprospiraceae bacterium]MCB9326140.1 KpsF/GutQ family sugar-phosphate isomerase [Lewinellaceae bacterium]
MKEEKTIINTALETINIEAETLLELRNSIDENFVTCIKAIFNSKGRLIISGIGKSAIVGQKIVATLNSTGTASLFMHAADAIHGDLGMIRPNDMLLCISKSGETAEIKVLVPLLKNMGNQLIGMTSRPESFLGKQSDFLLHTPIRKEADPNNLAPTASTTAQMALGDALATALLAYRGFSAKDFAKVHPGGALGKQLYLRVKDIYEQNEKPVVHPDTNLQLTIMEISSNRLGATAVVNDKGKLAGIITDGDLRRMLSSQPDLLKVYAKDIMTKKPKTIARDALAIKALDVMSKNSITQLVVAEGGKYYGFIHLHDLLREGLV